MNINDMKLALKREEIRVRNETVDGVNLSIVSYMVATPDLWDVENALEARGVTFDEQGNCIARTMEKFFNVGENKHTQLSESDFLGSYVFDKLDGSMISVVMINGKLFAKSKKSFYSDVALMAQKFIDINQSYQEFCKSIIASGYTPTFEFESPNAQIVVEQKEEKMTLLLVRDIESGKYLEFDRLVNWAKEYNVPVVNGMYFDDFYNGFLVSPDENFLDFLRKNVKDVEGWVFLLSTGQRVKLKTDWYLLRHRLTSYHERNIFDLIINEEIDDIMPLIEKKDGAVDIVNQIGHRIAHFYKITIDETVSLVNLWKEQNLSLSEIGKTYSGSIYFGLAIKLFKEQEPDYKKFVVNTYRKDFHTKAVFWGFDTDS